ncbi:MAG: hypothetical protein AAGM36_06705 [Cyanobacteria bacterium J06597_1]
MNSIASNYLKNRDFKTHVYGDVVDQSFYIWKVPNLWTYAANFATESVPLKTLVSEIDRMRWFNPAMPPTIRRIVSHCIKIQHADLSYPILLGPRGQVIDGSHRLAKALLEGHDSIDAIRLTAMPSPDLVTDTVAEGMEAIQNGLQPKTQEHSATVGH